MTGANDDRDEDVDGVPDSDPDHIDPAGDIADFMESEEFDVEVETEQDREDLEEFIERAERGEFGADPAIEASVRIARKMLRELDDDMLEDQ